MQKSSLRTCSMMARKRFGFTVVPGVSRGSSWPFIQALNSVFVFAASSTRPVDVAWAGNRAPRCRP